MQDCLGTVTNHDFEMRNSSVEFGE
jgi:hypothetical protein